MAKKIKPKRKPKLNPKQEKFCQLYTVHWNATRAAKEAGYSEDRAMQTGYDLREKKLVMERIEKLSRHALSEIGITRERILAEYSRIAFLDPALVYDEIGQLKPMKEISEDVRRAVSKIKIFEQFGGHGEDRELIGFTKEIEFSPKKGALDSLAKVLGMAPDRLEHSGPDGKPIQTETVMTPEQRSARIAALLEKRKK